MTTRLFLPECLLDFGLLLELPSSNGDDRTAIMMSLGLCRTCHSALTIHGASRYSSECAELKIDRGTPGRSRAF